jgi:hypothetical protein
MVIGMSAWRLAMARSILAIGCFACAGEDGGGDDSRPSAEPGAAESGAECTLPDEGYSAVCDECSARECCDTVFACTSDADCARQFSCVVRCQEAIDATACYEGCAATHPGYLAYEDCTFDRCLSTCWM